MILTCHRCPKQICFRGKNRDLMARLSGWLKQGSRYFCADCGDRVS